MKKWMLSLVVVLALAVPVVTLAAGGPPTDRGKGNGGVGTGVGLPTGDPLTAEQQAALISFWEDEQHALAVYESVMAQFGNIAPFAMIANAEVNHATTLENVFARYGVDVPAVPSFDVPAFATVEEACAAAAQAEIDNAALYDGLTSVFTQGDVLQVMNNLSSASLNQHLPAFESCADGEYEPGTGSGTGGYGNAGNSGNVGGRSGQGSDTQPATPGQGDPAASRGRGATTDPRGNAGQQGSYYPDCPIGQE